MVVVGTGGHTSTAAGVRVSVATAAQVRWGGRQVLRNIEAAVGMARGVLYLAAQRCLAATLAVVMLWYTRF